MNRIESFSAELVSPELFREICSLVASVSKSCSICATKAEDADDNELLMCAINSQNTFQMWVHLSSETMFNEFTLGQPEWLEVKSDSLAHAFRNEAGLLSMTEVRMRVSRKQAMSARDQGRDVGSTVSQSATPSTRLLSFTMDNKSVDAVATKAIEQRIYAEVVERDAALAEPSLAGIRYWADPNAQQLHQMSKVCDQYKQMSDTVRVTVSKMGLVTLVSETPDAIANTSWRVELAERADEPEEDEELFVGDEVGQDGNGQTGRPVRAPRDEESCAVLARDWYTVLQARKMCRRLVVGVLDGQGLVAYGFLKQGKSVSMQDVATFYLWHQD